MYLPDDIFKLKIRLKIIAFLFMKKKPASGIAVITARDGIAVS
jgi:hypothetical protein